MPNKLNLTSEELTALQKYLTVEEDWKSSEYKHRCSCICGKVVYKTGACIRNYPNSSCGCMRGMWQNIGEKQALRNSVYLAYKTNASKKKLDFFLTKEEAFFLFKEPCFYCGRKDYNKSKTRKRKGRKELKDRLEIYSYNGIDRIDNSIGYTKDNCVACCKICNISKSDLSLEEFKNWLETAYRWTFNDYSKEVESSDSKRETP